MLELVFLLDDFIDIILAVKISSQLGDLSFILLNSNFLIFEFLFQLNNSLILFNLCNNLLFLLSLPFFFSNFIHLGGQFFKLPFEFNVLLD